MMTIHCAIAITMAVEIDKSAVFVRGESSF